MKIPLIKNNMFSGKKVLLKYASAHGCTIITESDRDADAVLYVFLDDAEWSVSITNSHKLHLEVMIEKLPLTEDGWYVAAGTPLYDHTNHKTMVVADEEFVGCWDYRCWIERSDDLNYPHFCRLAYVDFSKEQQ